MGTVNMRYSKAYDVRVDRATRWGNPYRLGRDGDREQVIEMYRAYLWAEIRSGRVGLKALDALYGKRLGCWCAPRPCHGDVLAAAAEWAHNKLSQTEGA